MNLHTNSVLESEFQGSIAQLHAWIGANPQRDVPGAMVVHLLAKVREIKRLRAYTHLQELRDLVLLEIGETPTPYPNSRLARVRFLLRRCINDVEQFLEAAGLDKASKRVMKDVEKAGL